MRMKIHRMRFKNIRKFDNLELLFGDNEPHNVSMIQMANGTGKTTAINLLRGILHNKKFTPNEVIELKPRKYDASNGSVDLIISFDDKKYTLTLELDYQTGEHKYHTTSPAGKHGGRSLGYNIPSKFLFPEQFTKLFIFDGELAQDLLNREKDIAKGAIDLLYGTKMLIELSQSSSEMGDAEVLNSKSPISTNQGYKQQKTRLQNLQETLKKMEGDEKKLEGEIEILEEEINAYEARLNELLCKETLNEINELKERNSTLKKEVQERAGKMLELLRLPQNISAPLYANMRILREKMDKLKLPTNTASDFFKELCDSKYCICGTEINDEMKKNIIQSSEKCLSDDLQYVMNNVKRSIDLLLPNDEFTELNEDVNSMFTEISTNDRKLENLNEKISEDNATVAVELTNKIRDCKDVLKEKHGELEMLLDPYLNTDTDSNIERCKEQIENIKKNLNLSDNISNFDKKSKFLSIILKDIYEVSMKNLKDRIIRDTNDKLKNILHVEIVVDSVDKHIKIHGQRGGSAGEELYVGYTFLTSLFENAEYDLPFVIDSPCGSLDNKVRRKIAKMIPRLFKQVVMFITSSERPNFAEVILEECNDTQQITVWTETKPKYQIKIDESLEKFNSYQEKSNNYGEEDA